jgi:hypothetical protein
VKQLIERRKRQKGAELDVPVVEEVPGGTDPGTALATQSSSAGPLLGRVVSAENTKLYLALVNNALREPLPVLDFADPSSLSLTEHQDMVLRCKQKVLAWFDSLLFVYIFC